MSEEIDLSARLKEFDLKDFISWAMITMMTNISPDLRVFGPVGTYEVDLKVNGIPVSLKDMLTELDDQFQSMVLKQARMLLDDQLYGIMNRLNRLQEESKHLVREAGDKLGYKLTYGDDDD